MRKAIAARGGPDILPENIEAMRPHFAERAAEMAEKAQDQVIKDLDAGEIRGKEAATVYGIATDKLVKLAGWDRSENKEENFLNNLMKTLHGGGKLTVEVEPAEVIDVTPQGGDGVERAIGASRTPSPSSSAEKER